MFNSKKRGETRQPKIDPEENKYLFRRSRTITGTVSAKVNVTAAKTGNLKTARLKLHELKNYRKRIFRSFLGLVAIFLVIVWLGSNFILTPKVVGRADTADYQKSIHEYLADRPMERLGFLLNNKTIEAHLRSHFTEIKNVSLKKAWYGGDVEFVINFRTPLLVWKSGGQNFYVDETGTAFSYNHFKAPKLQVVDQSGVSPGKDGSLTSTRFITFLGKLVGAVNGYNKGQVNSVIIPKSTREIDLKIEKRNYLIKTHIDRDPLQQAEDIANALKYFDKKKIKPRYIDVRVAQKAFYKD